MFRFLYLTISCLPNAGLKFVNDYKNCKTYESLNEAINTGVNLVDANETLFILPTYSAMLETRKILTGKKIL